MQWEMECGCTGMEVEAFNLLQPLLQDDRLEVSTNKCDKLCDGYAPREVIMHTPRPTTMGLFLWQVRRLQAAAGVDHEPEAAASQ